jgi:hypothetical protein
LNAAFLTLEFTREDRMLEQLHDVVRFDTGLLARNQKGGSLERDVVPIEG